MFDSGLLNRSSKTVRKFNITDIKKISSQPFFFSNFVASRITTFRDKSPQGVIRRGDRGPKVEDGEKVRTI